MKKSIFLEKYPIFTLEVNKDEISQKSVDEIIDYFKTKIDEDKIANFISIFDQYRHTKSLNGDINPEIMDAKNIIFCFGTAIPNTKIAAIRPRSIAVCELKDNKFIIEFIEAPKEKMNEVMENWAKDLINLNR